MDRHELARAFLREAVFRSRSRQAAVTGLAGSSPADPFRIGRCGLGERAAVELDLSERGEELFAALWPEGLDPEALGRVHERMDAWVRRQDALDRRRNHFLRDFRHEHGFDRTAYTDDQRAAFENGLERVNAEAEDELDRAAAELAGVTAARPAR